MKDLTGQKFGRLTIIKCVGILSCGKYSWLCRCECGNEHIVVGGDLKRGRTKSCGCLKKEVRSKCMTKHAKRNSRLYEMWAGMKKRCHNDRCKLYHYYGGRGITVCEEWRDNFQAFYDWAMSNGYSDNLSIDRVDNNGNYEPSNCRFATVIEQQRNKRNNHNLTYNGKTQCLAAWSKELGVKYQTLLNRLRSGWSTERIIETPTK